MSGHAGTGANARHPTERHADRSLETAPRRRQAVFVGHDVYRRRAYGTMHPLAIPRVEAVVDLCNALGWFAEGEYRTSPCATEAELAWFHDATYIAALRDATESGAVDMATRRRYGIGTMENPLFPGVFERASTSVGGSIRAAELALDGHVAFHPAGGHASRTPRPRERVLLFQRPGVRDPAPAAGRRHACRVCRSRRPPWRRRAGCVRDDPRVRTLSIHEAGRWPHTGPASDTGEGRACNLPVPTGCNDDELRLLIDDVILPLVSRFAPEAVVLTCGGDALARRPADQDGTDQCRAVGRHRADRPARATCGGAGRGRLQSVDADALLDRIVGAPLRSHDPR